jgi:hypothetical protein
MFSVSRVEHMLNKARIKTKNERRMRRDEKEREKKE